MGLQDGLPQEQLKLLANDELHGLAAWPAVIQHGVLLVIAESLVVECDFGSILKVRELSLAPLYHALLDPILPESFNDIHHTPSSLLSFSSFQTSFLNFLNLGNF